MMEARVRLKDSPEISLLVTLIKTWVRGDLPAAVMSTSGGPKEQIRNSAFALFEADPEVSAVSMVRAGGPPFFLIRKGQQYFDVNKREVEVSRKKENNAL